MMPRHAVIGLVGGMLSGLITVALGWTLGGWVNRRIERREQKGTK